MRANIHIPAWKNTRVCVIYFPASINSKIKGNSGELLGFPPYRHTMNSDGSKSWVVDEEAAAVVRRIFNMTLDSMGTHQIADILASEKVLTPDFLLVRGQRNGQNKR